MMLRFRILLAAVLVLPVGFLLTSQATADPVPRAGIPTCDEDSGDQAAARAVAAATAAAPADEEDELCGPMAPGEFKALQDTSGGAGLPERALLRAAAQATGLPATGSRWASEGPTNVGGRVTGIAADPTAPGTVYVASASGGVWKSTDAGATYRPTWPLRFPQATGAVAVARDGTVYVGTGETNPGGGSLTYEGDGVYVSTDHGATWRHAGLEASADIGAIAVDPADPRRAYVAAGGSLFRDGGQRGVYRTADAGRHWTRVLAGTTPATGAVDVQLDPTDHNRVYAALWDRRRAPDLRTYAGTGSGLYRTSDAGGHWTRLQNITVPAPGDTVGLRSDPHLGRIGIGVATTVPGRVYVVTATYRPFGTELGFYRSDDFGDSFAAATKSDAGGDLWWTGKVWVDPRDADHVFVPGVALRESKDAGATWADTDGMHVDHHAMSWDPTRPGRVYEGNDGGAYRSDAAGATGSWVKGTVEPWSQFYSVAVSAQDPTRIAGGLQDNGSQRTWDGPRWNPWGGGDGEQNLIDPLDQQVGFNCFQFGACQRTGDGGTTFTPLAGRVADRYNWFAPLEFAADNPDVVYSGGNILNRSTDGGRTFVPISPDLTGGPGRDPVYPFGTLTTVATARTDPAEIVAGTDDGRVVATRDTGASWTVLLAGGQWVTRVKVDPRDRNRIWVTRSGYRAGTGDGHVMLSTDGGRHWRDVTGRLPDAPVNDVVLGPRGTVFVATDVGVFRGAPNGREWVRLGSGLPLAPVTDIEYNAGSGRLFAATFGRGVYSLPVTR